MTKLVLLIIFISLAFAVCVSTVLRLNYDERLSTLLTFLVATLLDTMLFRPAVILLMSFYDFLDLRATGWKNAHFTKVAVNSEGPKDFQTAGMPNPQHDLSAYAT